MKNLFSTILVMSFLFSATAYAKETFIICSGDKNASIKTFIFEINDRKKDVKLVEGLGVDEDKKIIKEFSKNYIDVEYDGIISYNFDEDNKLVPNKEQYVHFTISRMTGKMNYLMNERNNNKMLTMENFTCKKTEPIF